MFSIAEIVANHLQKGELLRVFSDYKVTVLPREMQVFLAEHTGTSSDSQIEFDLQGLLVMWALGASPFSNGDLRLLNELRNYLNSRFSVCYLAELMLKHEKEVLRS